MYTWVPGQGVDAASVARLRANFPKPADALFSWDPRDPPEIYTELSGDLSIPSVAQLAPGISNLTSWPGRSSRPDRTAWAHYLLAQLVTRGNDFEKHALVEHLVSMFIAHYGHGVDPLPYPEFHHDVLMTLGRCLMEPAGWSGNDVIPGKLLHRPGTWAHFKGSWRDASGDFSASMFFCLKYLPSDQVEEWLRSVLAIPSPAWRAQVMVWCVGAHEIFQGRHDWPCRYPDPPPNLFWAYSGTLSPGWQGDDKLLNNARTFISAAASETAMRVLTGWFTQSVHQQWISSLQKLPSHDVMMANHVLERFPALYVRQ